MACNEKSASPAVRIWLAEREPQQLSLDPLSGEAFAFPTRSAGHVPGRLKRLPARRRFQRIRRRA